MSFSRSAIAEPLPPPQPRGNYVDIDRLVSSDGLVAIFSQRRWDGVITFAIVREFPKVLEGREIKSQTGFIPETLLEAYVAHVKLAHDHMAKLREKRHQGLLPFREGGQQGGQR